MNATPAQIKRNIETAAKVKEARRAPPKRLADNSSCQYTLAEIRRRNEDFQKSWSLTRKRGVGEG